MLFAWLQRLQTGAAHTRTGGNAGIRGNTLVAGIASNMLRSRVTDYGGEYQRGGSISISGQLCQAGEVVVDNRAGRNAVDEALRLETGIGVSVRRGGCAGGDHLPGFQPLRGERIHNAQKL